MVEEKKSLEDLKELKKNDEVVDQVTSEKIVDSITFYER